MSNQKPAFILSPKKVAYFLATVMILLVFVHVIGVLMKYILGHPKVYGLIPFFDLDEEQNLPTLFSTCLFIINGILFFIMWKLQQHNDKRQGTWLFLSALFIFLAIDEFGEIHEQFTQPVKLALSTSGFLYYAWVIPYGIAGILLSIYLVPFFWKMNKKIRTLFFLSALSYLVGAIGFEMIAAWYVSTREYDIVNGFLILFEESFEMTGLIMLVYTLLLLFQKKWLGFEVILHSPYNPSDTIDEPINKIEKPETN